MIAIAESGSTKTEWFVLNDEGEIVNNFNTQGFNPDFHSANDISAALKEVDEIVRYSEQVCKVYFFGASCSSEVNIAKVKAGIQAVFTTNSIHVDHDLLACAYALSDGQPLITCILGTGSNSAYFDGEKMQEEIPALGVFMGDEGSGAYFGKRFIRDYFYKKLPKEMEDEVNLQFNLKWSEVRQVIYGSNQANVYLALFMPFIYQFKDHPYVRDIVEEGIAAFIDAHVCCFSEYPSKEVGFVGTLAFLFQDIVDKKLSERGFKLVKVVKGPGKNLVEYLIKYKGILDTSTTNATSLAG